MTIAKSIVAFVEVYKFAGVLAHLVPAATAKMHALTEKLASLRPPTRHGSLQRCIDDLAPIQTKIGEKSALRDTSGLKCKLPSLKIRAF